MYKSRGVVGAPNKNLAQHHEKLLNDIARWENRIENEVVKHDTPIRDKKAHWRLKSELQTMKKRLIRLNWLIDAEKIKGKIE